MVDADDRTTREERKVPAQHDRVHVHEIETSRVE